MAAARARVALSTLRPRLGQVPMRTASGQTGAHTKAPRGELPWMIGSAAVFGPTLFWLLGPDAPGKHDSGHHDHSDTGRALYRNPSREPKWTEEDEKAERAASGEEDDEESSGGDEDGDSSDETDKEDSGDDAEEKPKALQSRSNKPASNKTPRDADPDKLGDAGKHQMGTEHPDPKAFIEDFRKKKAAGETSGEQTLSGGRKDMAVSDDPSSEEAKSKNS